MRPQDEMSIPVVRLEIEYMKHSILQAFTEYSAKVDADVREAVERFCAPGNVKVIINKAVEQTLKHAIEAEIEKFFQYGAGRHVIAEAVKTKLEKDAADMKRWGLT